MGTKMRRKIEMNGMVEEENSITFDRGYDEFILNCKVRNLRPTTLKYYDDIINIWYKCVPYKTPINEITKETVDGFVMYLKTQTREKDTTINTILTGVRAILKYFMSLGYMEEFKIQKLKLEETIKETYSDEELKLLLKKPNLKDCTFIEYRTWVIINFFLATGCRAKTLCSMKIKDLDFSNGLITYGYTKNRKQQIVPMSNSLKIVLIEYLKYRKGKDENLLFVNAYGNELTVDQLNHNVKDYNNSRKVQSSGLHRFRHTFAKKWVLAGGDAFRLQKMLCFGRVM